MTTNLYILFFSLTAVSWKIIHEKVRSMLRLIFEGAIALHPEMHSATARAIYGVDVLLTSDFEPKLLEVETAIFRVYTHIYIYICQSWS